MDALDHCRTTRKSLRQKAAEANIGAEKLIIPEDGETIKLWFDEVDSCANEEYDEVEGDHA